MFKAVGAIALAAVSVDAGAVEITMANHADYIGGGKNAFVKFLAPW